MKKLFFTLFALCLCAPVIAGDSGLYFDRSRDGEGISLHRDGDLVVFYFFTFGDDDGVGDDDDVVGDDDDDVVGDDDDDVVVGDDDDDVVVGDDDDDVVVGDDDDDVVGGVNGQRWFFAADNFDENTMESGGFLYIAKGVNYPFGEPSDTDPEVDVVGEAQAVGMYSLERVDEGYRMIVERFGEILEEDDYLFEAVFNFNTLLISAND